jgi:prepilin-type N-terminal cleavage/methylation domain-containing protein
MTRPALTTHTQEAVVTRSTFRRPGFTLVELLVVIAIMATLSAVAVGALFRIRSAQDKSNTEATLSKLDTKLNQKLKAIQEKVRDPRSQQNPHYQAAYGMSGNSHEVAQAILMYAYTRNELPMTFAEAKSNTVFGTLTLTASPIYASLPVGTGAPEESAVCIYLALSTTGNEGLEQQIGDVPTMPGQKCYLDQYGQPIYFNRLAYNGDNGELNNPPFVKAPVAANLFDPFYSKPANTGGYRDFGTDVGAASANALWAAVVPPSSTYTAANNWAQIPGINAAPPLYIYPGKLNHVSTLISGGLNKGLTEPGGLYTGDNIFSYRLRKEGQKGD